MRWRVWLSAYRKASIRSVRPHPDLNRITLFLSHWMKILLPPALPGGAVPHLRAALGALMGIGITGWICRDLIPTYPHALWLMAPLGASSVLIFVVPKSPFSHPWSVIVGNLISALSGMIMVFLIKDVALAAGLAVGLAIAMMILSRSLHPPGGGVAVLTALMNIQDPRFLGLPVLINSLLLVGIGLGYNWMADRAFKPGS